MERIRINRHPIPGEDDAIPPAMLADIFATFAGLPCEWNAKVGADEQGIYSVTLNADGPHTACFEAILAQEDGQWMLSLCRRPKLDTAYLVGGSLPDLLDHIGEAFARDQEGGLPRQEDAAA